MTKADILERVKHRGERVTMPRLAVIEALCALDSHQTAQSIQQHLTGQQIDLEESTVYRVLQWLKDLGIVAQTDLGQSGITYEVVSTPPHHHLVCLVCGQIQDVDDSVLEPLRRHLRADYAFEPRIDHMAFFGICCRCRSAGSVDREDAESLPPR